MTGQRVTARSLVEAAVLLGALVGLGLLFPPWGYVGVAVAYLALTLWRLSRRPAD